MELFKYCMTDIQLSGKMTMELAKRLKKDGVKVPDHLFSKIKEEKHKMDDLYEVKECEFMCHPTENDLDEDLLDLELDEDGVAGDQVFYRNPRTRKKKMKVKDLVMPFKRWCVVCKNLPELILYLRKERNINWHSNYTMKIGIDAGKKVTTLTKKFHYGIIYTILVLPIL